MQPTDLPRVGIDMSPPLVCSCGATFTAPVHGLQEVRGSDGTLYAILGLASHDPAECPQMVNGTKAWEIWELADEDTEPGR